jgi:hypothetical protein
MKRKDKTPLDDAFPEVQTAIDKAHDDLVRAFEGEISFAELRASQRAANKAISGARKKMAAMRRAPKKVE